MAEGSGERKVKKMTIAFRNWNIEAMTGYHPISTFYMDFSIADAFGKSAVKDAYKRAFAGWKGNYKMLTELVMVLNWKSWEHERNEALCDLYIDLYEKARDYAIENLKGDELRYFWETTD